MLILPKITVYLLTNKINEKIYIGKSINTHKRFILHKTTAKIKNYRKTPISRAIYKYGWENFEVTILESFEKINDEELINIEAKWIKKLKSCDKEIGYNLCMYSRNRMGFKHSKETKEKMAKAQVGKKHSAETRLKLSIVHQGKGIKPVNQIDPKTNEIIKRWNSIKEANSHLSRAGKSATHISTICNSIKNNEKAKYGRKTALGFKWEYA